MRLHQASPSMRIIEGEGERRPLVEKSGEGGRAGL